MYPAPGIPHAGPPVKRRSKLPWILGGAAVLLLLCCGGGAVIVATGDPTTDTASDSAAPTPAQEEPKDPAAPTKQAAPKVDDKPKPAAGPGVGDPVRDGKFEFVVHGVKCGSTRVGNEFMNEQAQGVFCRVTVTVKNIGKEAQTFSGASQKAFDAKGTEFSNDTAAEIYANEGSNTFLQDINPGNQVKGVLIFDVPKGTKLTKLELHDSMFSGGVTVNLG
jgi:hypothetical protein